jgi:hypothetical protein
MGCEVGGGGMEFQAQLFDKLTNRIPKVRHQRVA